MKIIVVYDSLTGNTKKIAEAIAEGDTSVNGVNVEIKKIGEPFSVTDLTKADGVFFGSPAIYANVTVGMRNLVENMRVYVKAGMADFKALPPSILKLAHSMNFSSTSWPRNGFLGVPRYSSSSQPPWRRYRRCGLSSPSP